MAKIGNTDFGGNMSSSLKITNFPNFWEKTNQNEKVGVGGLPKTLRNLKGWSSRHLTFPYRGRYMVQK